MISIAFVDDHPILLSGVASLFRANPAFQVVGFGSNAADALEIARRHAPDIIVVDINMPGNILQTIADICKHHPATKVMAFTAVTSVDHAASVLEAGALGYVLKGSSEDELLLAIRSVHEGETFITPGFAAKVIAGLRTATLRRARAAALRLTSREQQIMHLLLHGKTNREIAEALRISDKTVKHYMTVLMQRLNVRNRIEVVLAAQGMGMAKGSLEHGALN